MKSYAISAEHFFTRKDNFKRHYAEVHGNHMKVTVKSLKCILCEKVFTRRENLKRHMKRAHKDFEEELITDFELF